jgi:hypothetical protein
MSTSIPESPFYPTRLIKLLDNEEEVQLVSKDTLVCSSISLFNSNINWGVTRSMAFPFVVYPKRIIFQVPKNVLN